MKLPKFTCVCLTFDRPEFLPYALYSYLEQDYPDDRIELLILDDAGQYRCQSNSVGKPWELISVSRRFSSIGAKRNAAISMVSRDTDAIVIWDDDDVYLPWTLQAHAAVLAEADWSRPSLVVDQQHEDLKICEACDQYIFHAAWAFRLDMFRSAGGYGDIVSGEDKDLAQKFVDGKVKCADPMEFGFDPYFVFNRSGSSFHISYMSQDQYHTLIPRDVFIEKLEPYKWAIDYVKVTHNLMAKRRLGEVNRSAVLYRVMESLSCIS